MSQWMGARAKSGCQPPEQKPCLLREHAAESVTDAAFNYIVLGGDVHSRRSQARPVSFNATENDKFATKIFMISTPTKEVRYEVQLIKFPWNFYQFYQFGNRVTHSQGQYKLLTRSLSP